MMQQHTAQGDPCARCAKPASQHRAPRAYHEAQGDPCKRCGLPASKHRVQAYHEAQGDPCERCGKHAARHRTKDESPETRARRAAKDKGRKRKGTRPERPIIFLDGEGVDTHDGRHLYVYLAAVDEFGTVRAERWNQLGLTHEEICEVIERLPVHSMKVGFMLSYDETKWIETLPIADRYRLMRPETRRQKRCLGCQAPYQKNADGVCRRCQDERSPRDVTTPVKHAGRTYEYFAGSFTLGTRPKRTGKVTWGPSGPVEEKGKRRSLKIWDVFKFFQSSFVAALDDWQIGTPEERYRIRAMKERRGDFKDESPEDIRRYCKDECRLGAQLVRALLTAHKEAGIDLRRYDGAGSTAGALLRKHNVAAHRGKPLDMMHPELSHAIMSSYFGGRFENSAIGIVRKPVWQEDIASAYPYAQTALPCLACGTWRRHVLNRDSAAALLADAPWAVAQFHVRGASLLERTRIAWMPLPCRDENGSIVYGTGFRGWAWKEELCDALAFAPNHVELTGLVWTYETACSHKPFGYVPGTYCARLAWGKEGRGKVLKLGLNAGYGRTAQNIGADPPFRSWAWAGMTTATCRGQATRAMMSARDRWSILSVATDGIVSSERLSLPAPRDTGTFEACDVKTGTPKPLGSWESKELPEGLFLIKPGLYFRLRPELKDVRARGVGRKEVYRDRETLLTSFEGWDRRDFEHVTQLPGRRYWGAKHSIYAHSRCEECRTHWPGLAERRCPTCNKIGDRTDFADLTDENGVKRYGTWGERVTDIRFDPHPKRERRLYHGASHSRLIVRDLNGIESASYDGRTTPEGEASRLAREIAEEQPDAEEWE